MICFYILVTIQTTHFGGVAYPPNKISKTVLKMQAFYTFFEILLGSEQLHTL